MASKQLESRVLEAVEIYEKTIISILEHSRRGPNRAFQKSEKLSEWVL